MPQIEAPCCKYGVRELAVFGSALRDDSGPESDVDFLVRFENHESGPWGEKLLKLESELSRILARPADVVPKNAIADSKNSLQRRAILESASLVYES